MYIHSFARRVLALVLTAAIVVFLVAGSSLKFLMI